MHDRIGTQINSENRTQQFYAIRDPLATVFKIKTGVGILSTHKSWTPKMHQKTE